MTTRDPAEPPKAAPRGGPRAFARSLRDLSHLPRGLALARLGYDLKRPVFALPIYRYSLTGAAPTALAATPPDPWPGDAGRGAEIVQGVFDLAGQRLANPAPLWAPAEAGAAWRAELHGFGWLRDLRAAGGDGARRVARELVGAWLDSHGRWSVLAWDPLIGGRRLANWLGAYEFFAASAAVDYRHRLFRSMARQAQHLHRVLPAGLAGMELIAALKGLIAAGACLPGGAAWKRRGLAILERELPRQILADGGHAARSPAHHLAVLRDLIDLRATLHRAELQEGELQEGDPGGGTPGGHSHGGSAGAPDALHEAIERM
ncbi:MAG: heparinase II/III family protein, partial [Kiloniellales bacterium]